MLRGVEVMGHGRRAAERGWPAGKRPLARFCLAFSGAVFLAVYLLPRWGMLLLGGVLLYGGLAAALRRRIKLAAALLGAVLGLLLCWYRATELTRLESDWAGQKVEMELLAQTYPQETSRGLRLEVEVLAPEELAGKRLNLWLPEGMGLRPGDQISATVRLSASREASGSWRLYWPSQGVALKGSAQWAEITRREPDWTVLPQLWAGRLRQGLERCLDRETAGFLLALTTGNRSGLTEALEEALSDTGLSHVVAASGLHVNLLCTALSLLPGRRRWRGLILLPALAAFAAVAGFTPSVCRAVVMEGLLLFGPLVGREEDGPTSLALALALLLAQNPYAAASVSLQLSFAAVLGLQAVCPRLLRYTAEEPRRWLRWVQSSLAVSLGANLFTLPLVLLYFGEASILAPVSNLVVLWLLSPLLPLGLACALTGWLLPALAGLLALPTGLLAQVVLGLIRLLAGFPWAGISGSGPFLAWLLLCYGLGLLLWWGQCTAWQSLAGALTAVLLLPVAWVSSGTGEAALTASLLDVGQGQCLLLVTQSATAVVDCGSSSGGGARELEQALSAQGRTEIDLLILTHYDQDHTSGVAQLLLEGRVNRLCLPPALEEDEVEAEALATLAQRLGAEVTWIAGETELVLDPATLTLLPVEGGDYCGLAVLTSLGEFDLLVTGDAGVEEEALLLEAYDLPRTEVLVAGHHGSAGATGTELLEAIGPQAVLFSAGSGNSYGHPTQEALDRCLAAGAQVWRTDLNGTVTLQIDAQGDG